MASVKITVTLPDAQVAAIRQLVADDRSSSVSGFVQHAVGLALDDMVGWELTLNEALADTGGPMTGDEREWADGVLNRGSRSVS